MTLSGNSTTASQSSAYTTPLSSRGSAPSGPDLESWVVEWQQQGGLHGKPHRMVPALIALRKIQTSLFTAPAADVSNVATLLNLKISKSSCGKPNKPERLGAMLQITDRATALEVELGKPDASVPEGKEEAVEDTSPSATDVDEDEVEHDQQQSSQSSSSTSLPRLNVSHLSSPLTPTGTKARRRAAVEARAHMAQEQGVSDEDFQLIETLLQRPADAVSEEDTAMLRENGERLYHIIRQQRRKTSVSFDPSAASRSLYASHPLDLRPPLLGSASGRSSSAPMPHRTPVQLHTAAANSLAGSSSSSTSSLHGDVTYELPREVIRPRVAATSALSPLYALLQRHGVPDDLMAGDALERAVGQAMGGSLEQHWTSHYSGLLRSSQAPLYYEGLVLSMLLDHKNDPHIWTQVAARRWTSCTLAADGHPWLAARYLLPMTGAGNLSATLLESLYRHAQSRSNQSLLPHSSGGGVPAYNSQRGDARANSRKREAGGGGGGSTADAAATTHAATSDKSNKSRRGGRGGRGRGGGGAGAAQNGAAGAQG